MNGFIDYEQEEVQCFCFHSPPGRAHMRLQAPHTVQNIHPSSSNYRFARSIEAKSSRQMSKRVKTSLKRDKPEDGLPQRAAIEYLGRPREEVASNERGVFENEKIQRKLGWSETKKMPNAQIPEQLPIALPNYPKRQQQGQWVHPINRVVTYSNVPPLFQLHTKNNAPSQNPQMFIQTPYIQPRRDLVNYISQPFNDSRFSSQQPKSISNQKQHFRKSGASTHSQKVQQKLVPPRKHLRMELKEIQSIVDDNQVLSDQLSEVIGRGWQNDDRSMDFAEETHGKTKTETTAMMASQVKNSTLYSMFGATESHFGRH